jgi:hypothetical protein
MPRADVLPRAQAMTFCTLHCRGNDRRMARRISKALERRT